MTEPGGDAVAIVRLATVDSTNSEAWRRLGDGRIASGPVAVVAGEQTAGRGTRGRRWDSPAGQGLYLSLAIPSGTGMLTGAPVDAPWTLAAGVAAVEALRRTVGLDVALKPVNDLLVDGRKLGGILVESSLEAGRVTSLVIGCGLNVRGHHRDVGPSGLPAVSLEMLRAPGLPVGDDEVRRLTDELVERLVDWTRRAGTEPRGTIEAAWRSRAVDGAVLPVPGGGDAGAAASRGP